jgi:serine phosphatase RsbU (regulator of sigma subunit)
MQRSDLEMSRDTATVAPAAGDLGMARRVQGNLLPDAPIRLKTLDYTGTCLQAGAVGGDYFDFIPLAPDRMALLLADISGKGVSAALLMANLQALLRSQCAAKTECLCTGLRMVNRLFCESSAPEHYATLFYSEYDDRTGELSYVNCGHNPPLLLRSDGRVEWLLATATVLGLFERWDCEIGRMSLKPGDLLVLYSDGVIEASNPSGEEFGRQRLVRLMRGQRRSSSRLVLRSLLDEVRDFSGARQDDDQAAIVARRRS